MRIALRSRIAFYPQTSQARETAEKPLRSPGVPTLRFSHSLPLHAQPPDRTPPFPSWVRHGLLIVVPCVLTLALASDLWSPHSLKDTSSSISPEDRQAIQTVASAVDASFNSDWQAHDLLPAGPTDALTIARRLSLALTGSIPSLQDIRTIEVQPSENQRDWWLEHLLADRRSADYIAERLTRVYVGTEVGQLLTYRRTRLVSWLSDALHENRPYDRIAHDLIAAEGIWTTNPAVNFLSVTMQGKKGPDEAKMAARVSRAFLGTQMDCVQCHDGKLGSPWEQEDFHELAAFFGQSTFNLTGLRDTPKQKYRFRYLNAKDEEVIPVSVPWKPELLPEKGPIRERLAEWVTSPENKSFARAMVNRMWALMFNRPLVLPVDEIPLEGPFPQGMEILADDFIAHDYDLHRLIRTIANTAAFQMRSDSDNPDLPPTAEAETHWAVFPLTRLRPDQMAGSVTQAASLSTLNAETNVLLRLKRGADVRNFVKRYGDVGEDSFEDGSSTIPQRLLLMNGRMIANHTEANPIFSAAGRIALLSPDNAAAVETAYLAVLTRRPTPDEAAHFAAKLEDVRSVRNRGRAISDLYWTLMNCTEFSWNH